MSVEQAFKAIREVVRDKFDLLMNSTPRLTQLEMMDALYRWAVNNPVFIDCSGEFYGDSESNHSLYYCLTLRVTHNPTARLLDVVLDTETSGRIRLNCESTVI
jgi:hypothetical protein